jgi:hypothetical protein
VVLLQRRVLQWRDLAQAERNGITPDQLAAFQSSTIELDTTLSPPSITVQGNPGIFAGINGD